MFVGLDGKDNDGFPDQCMQKAGEFPRPLFLKQCHPSETSQNFRGVQEFCFYPRQNEIQIVCLTSDFSQIQAYQHVPNLKIREK